MPKFKVDTNMGFCGTDETYIVEAENEMEAERMVYDVLYESVSACAEELPEDWENEEGYTEI